MSTAPAWRQEVNRRLAEHKGRKASASSSSASAQSAGTEANLGSSRAAEAAARVAARYAKAPTYSQMQAEEARIAVRAAEIATRVALEAQSVAESALAELHAATRDRAPAELFTFPVEAAPQAEPEPSAAAVLSPTVSPAPTPAAPIPAPEWNWAVEQTAGQATAEPTAAAHLPEPAAELLSPRPVMEPEAAPPDPSSPVTSTTDSAGQLLQIRWEPDMPLRAAETAPPEPFELSTEDWFTAAEQARHTDEPVHVEAHPIHANLIEFPRELVATRRMRPRLAEGPIPEPEPGTQLSIFEVDPGSVQTEAPAPVQLPRSEEPELQPEPAASVSHSAPAPVSWATAEWPGMKLDPQAETAPSSEARKKLALAPLSRRLLAGVVDFTLIAAFAAFAWLTLALGMAQPLVPRMAEILGAGLFALTGLAYHAFFHLLSLRTPGMRYAGLSLCTLDDCVPTPQQLRRRLGAMVLSMLPLGLGMVWGVFDEDHLNWHDRFSQTYLRHS